MLLNYFLTKYSQMTVRKNKEIHSVRIISMSHK